MQKNTLQPLALALAIVSVIVFLPHSVAQLREAARSGNAPPARQITGPRRRPLRLAASTVMPDVLQKILDRSGIQERQRPLAASVLGLMDTACLQKLQTFTVLYDNPKHRGLAGKGVIIVAGNVPDQEFMGLLMHEGLGHYREITCLTGTKASGSSAFKDGSEAVWNNDPSVLFYAISWESEKKRKPGARDADFVTGYAYEADNFEDLAECVTYYMTQENAFRSRAVKNPVLAKKLAWLETYMPKPRNIAQGNAWDGKIAWDATKLGFTWMGN